MSRALQQDTPHSHILVRNTFGTRSRPLTRTINFDTTDGSLRGAQTKALSSIYTCTIADILTTSYALQQDIPPGHDLLKNTFGTRRQSLTHTIDFDTTNKSLGGAQAEALSSIYICTVDDTLTMSKVLQ